MNRNDGRTLYRIPEQGKVAGICAGLAEYFNLEVWLVRIVALSALILTGVFSFVLLLYIVAWVLLDKKPVSEDKVFRGGELKTKIYQPGESPREALREIGTRFRSLELRLRRMEQHVTSDGYNLRREIDNLK